MSDRELVIVRDWRNRAIPRDNPPNANAPLGTVGPNVPEGFGDIHVAYPLDNPPMQVQAWAGWPVEWETPLWNGQVRERLVSTVWTCIDLNTRQMATFPTYGMRGIDAVALPEWSNNPEPEMYADWIEAAKQAFNSFQLRGEIFLWCTGRYANGTVARWVVLNPDFMNVEWADGEIEYSLGGSLLERKDICHIRYQTYPGNLRGITPLAWAGRNVDAASAAEDTGTNLHTRGGVPWGVLKHPRKLDGPKAMELQNSWVSASTNRRGAPAILSGGIELEVLQISPADMSLIESRVFDETRIASAFGVPPFLVGLPNPPGMTYSNATSLFDFHWRATLRPMGAAVASAMSSWLLPRGTRMEFNRDDYVKPPLSERASGYATLFNLIDEHGNRAMTIDEIRTAERFVPAAMVASPTDLIESVIAQ